MPCIPRSQDYGLSNADGSPTVYVRIIQAAAASGTGQARIFRTYVTGDPVRRPWQCSRGGRHTRGSDENGRLAAACAPRGLVVSTVELERPHKADGVSQCSFPRALHLSQSLRAGVLDARAVCRPPSAG